MQTLLDRADASACCTSPAAPAHLTGRSAAVLVVGFFLLEPRAIPRPHLVSFRRDGRVHAARSNVAARSRSPAPLLASIPIVALWSNLHVECVFGVLLIGLFALGELARPTVLTRRDAVVREWRRRGLGRRDHGQPVWLGADGVSLREPVRAADHEDRRARARRTCPTIAPTSCTSPPAILLASQPRRTPRLGTPRCGHVRRARADASPADAARAAGDSADGRGPAGGADHARDRSPGDPDYGVLCGTRRVAHSACGCSPPASPSARMR